MFAYETATECTIQQDSTSTSLRVTVETTVYQNLKVNTTNTVHVTTSTIDSPNKPSFAASYGHDMSDGVTQGYGIL